MKAEWHGTPIPWPTGLPEELTPAGFERTVRRAAAECAPSLEIVGFECNEPPCLVLLRPPPAEAGAPSSWWDDLVNKCPTWVDAYGSSVSSSNGQASCVDGSRETYELIGWSPALVEADQPSLEDQENRTKRFGSRIDEIRQSWRCHGD